jgi:hypothetical protein
MEAFRECLDEHGAELPDPPDPPDAGSAPPAEGLELPAPSGKTQRALEACADLAPAPPQPGGGFGVAPIPQD